MVRVIAIFLMLWPLLLTTSFLADGVIRLTRMVFVPLSGMMTFGGLGVVCYFLFRSPAEPTSETSHSLVAKDSHTAFDFAFLLHECQAFPPPEKLSE